MTNYRMAVQLDGLDLANEYISGPLKGELYIAEKEGIERAICDYIAGMTDTFAINLFKDIFLPRSSKIF